MLLLVIASVIVAGALGGVVNAILSDNSFILPAIEQGSSGTTVWRPGILGNALVSATAALISWGLYGPDATLNLFKTFEPSFTPNFSISALVGAVLVGMGGARWLTAEVDKKLLRGAAISAAKKDVNQTLAAKLAVAPPVQAFVAARDS